MRRLMRIIHRLIFAALALSLARPASTCTCMPPGSLKSTERRTMLSLAQAYAEAFKLVFEGEVEKQDLEQGTIGPPKTAMSMTGQGAHRKVVIRASRVYRGAEQKSFVVITGLGLGDCGFDFQAGEKYLVYADPIGDGTFFTSICSGTNSLDQSAPALRFLRGETPAPEDVIDERAYMEQMQPKWFGSACGTVSFPDGTPFGGASVELWQVRSDPFPSYRIGDLSKKDGTFCVGGLPRGKYLLTAEGMDFDSGTRFMGFFPGVWKHSEAVPVEVRPGPATTGLRFSVHLERIFTVSFRIVVQNGDPAPWKNLGIAIDSPDSDPLAYHEHHGVNENGTYALGGIPAGHYTVSTYFQPDFDQGEFKFPADLEKWRPAKQEVDISGTTEVVLKLLQKP